MQGQLSQTESELNKAMDRNKGMEQQQAQLNDQIKELKQEINNLRANMTLLDQEKDRLLVNDSAGNYIAISQMMIYKIDYFFFCRWHWTKKRRRLLH